ncbi:MAG: 30S ribosomal protein S1 [Zetaproteobacteria bacterium]|nr:30S ribosomal protein S1 [Zetaproteobacteria bacterium]
MTNNFDTDQANLDANATPDDESFAALFEASLQTSTELNSGAMITGIVVTVDNDVVILDVGTKAEAMIPVAEFQSMGSDLPKVGDELSALVVSNEGRMRLSVLEAHKSIIWKSLEEAMAQGKTVAAQLVKETKGGYQVTISGVRAFMPRSESGSNLQGINHEIFEVALIELSRRPENIVVSRKRPQQLQLESIKQSFFESVALGDKIIGKVKRLTDYGAFIDVGGIDGLLHISDMAWRRFDRPDEILTIGQQVNVEIIKLDAEQGKISLSMKSLIADPWDEVEETYEPGMRLTGTVRRLLKFGAVVELQSGVEGMIHISEMSWTNKSVQPSQMLHAGDVVDVAVLSIEPSERRIALSLRAVTENPWQAWLADHPAGSKVSGKIRNIKPFGFFVGLTDELDGMVHIGDLSWNENGDEQLSQYKKGQEVECVVLGVDIDKQRIALGIKQLSSDPFELFVKGAQRGAMVHGKVIAVEKGAAMVEVAEGVVARLALREMPKDAGEPVIGSEVEAKVIDVNRKRREVNLSVNQLLRDQERDAVKHYSKQMQEKEQPSALALALLKLKQ